MSRSEPPPGRFSGSSPEVGKARLAVGEPRHTYRSTREPLYTPGRRLGPFSTRIWLEVRLDAQWVAAYRLVAQNGRPVVAEVRLLPYEEDAEAGEWSGRGSNVPAGGLRTEQLRELRTEQTLESARDVVDWWDDQGGREFVSRIQRRWGVDPDKARGAVRRPQAIPDEELARIAAAYVEECRRTRSPRKALAEREQLTPSTISNYLDAARERGILTPTVQGRAGGNLTDYGRRLAALADD
jgi:hypothetical protein